MARVSRRALLHLIGTGGLATAITPREAAAEQAVAQATRAVPVPRIRDLTVIETAPGGVRLTVVKITTDQAVKYADITKKMLETLTLTK